MNRADVGWAIAVGLLLAWISTGRDNSRAYARIEAAEDSLAVLAPLADSLSREVAGLRAVAVKSDTVRILVEREAIGEVDRAMEAANRSADSLRATLDSVQSVMLANVEEAHAAEIAAVWQIADARLLWGQGWKDYAIAGEELASIQNATIVQLRFRDEIMQGVLRQERQQVWLSRGLATVGVIAVLVLK